MDRALRERLFVVAILVIVGFKETLQARRTPAAHFFCGVRQPGGQLFVHIAVLCEFPLFIAACLQPQMVEFVPVSLFPHLAFALVRSRGSQPLVLEVRVGDLVSARIIGRILRCRLDFLELRGILARPRGLDAVQV